MIPFLRGAPARLGAVILAVWPALAQEPPPPAPDAPPAADAASAVSRVQVLLHAARASVQRRDWPQALARFEEALALKPDDLDTRKEFAGVLFQSGDAERALSEYDRILQEAPLRADVRDAAVDALLALRDIESAIARLRAYPPELQGPEQRLRLARACMAADRPDDALPLFVELARAAPDRRAVRREYLGAMAAAADSDRFARAVSEYLAVWPDDADVLLYRVDALLMQDRAPEALRQVEQLIRDPATARDPVWMRWADLRLACGSDPAVVRARLESVAEGRRAPELRARLAVLYAYSGLFQPACAALHQAVREGVGSESASVTRAELLGLGGLHRTAYVAFDRQVRLHRASPRALKGMAEAARALRRSDDARAALRRALIQFPGDMDATYRYIALLEERGEFAAALDLVTPLLKRRPDNLTARLLRARLLAAAGRAEEAQADFDALAAVLADRGPQALVAEGFITRANLNLVSSRVWRAVCERRAADAAARAELAAALFREADFDASARVGEEAVQLAPDAPLHHLGLVEALTARGLAATRGARDRVAEELPKLVASERLDAAGLARLAEFLVRTERWGDVLVVTERRLRTEPRDTHAVALHAGALMRLDRPDEALREIAAHLAEPPDNPVTPFRLWTRLGAMARSKDDAAYRHSQEGLRALLAVNPGNSDVLQAVGWLAVIHKDYPAGRAALDEALRQTPADAEALLWRARLESWDGQYADAVAFYDRYSRANPADRRVLLERARVHGWALDYEKSLREYTRGIREDGASDPPGADASVWARSLYLEREAKRALWNDRLRAAAARYDDLLTLEPEDPELLFDRGQVESRLSMSRRAADLYERTLLVAPGHTQARDALDFEERRMAASLTAAWSYRREKGSGDLFGLAPDALNDLLLSPKTDQYLLALSGGDFDRVFRIEEHLLTLTLWSPEIADGVWLGVQGEQGWYGFDVFPNVTAQRARIMARKRFESSLQLDAWYQAARYSEVEHRSGTWGAQARRTFFDTLDAAAGYAREDVVENFLTLADDVQRDVFRLDLGARVTRRIRADAWGAWVRVNDGNDGRRGGATGSFEILQYPRILKILYSAEYWDYDQNNRTYFSPNGYVQHGPALHWRHYLNREHYVGAKELYYGIRLPLAVNTEGDVYLGAAVEFLWDLTRHWQIGADASLTSGDPYDGLFARAWIQYRF